MGVRSSCFHFNKLLIALEWICQHKCLTEYLIHLLDDFLAIESPDAVPTASATIKQVFKRLCVPLVDHKCVGPTACLEFLGIILDSLRLEAQLSQDKISKLLNIVDHFIGRPKCTKKELLSLIGTFNFAAMVVVPGCTFLSQMIKLSCTVHKLSHHIYLNKDFREDLDMWGMFLQEWNGHSFFLEDQLTAAPDFQLFTDAAGAVGYGAYFQGHWFCGAWTEEQKLGGIDNNHIAYQKLFPITLAALIWGDQWSSKRLQFNCDNMTTVLIINKGCAKCPKLSTLLQRLVLQSMRCNFLVRAKHLPRVSNGIADSLSHLQIQRFRQRLHFFVTNDQAKLYSA